MRRGLLALLVLLGSSPVAFAQGGQFFAQIGTPQATSKVSTDEVVARIMTFDQNNDGRVSIGELSERMRPVVARGDKNGDGALDRSEIVALSRTPSTQNGRVAFPNSGYGFGEDVGFSSRQHIEGALEDLRLTSDKTERVLPRLRAYVDQVEIDAKADLLRQLEPVLSPAQLWDLTQVLNNQPREVTLRTNANGEVGTRVFRLNAGADPARRLESMGLAAPNKEQARKAIDEYKSRIRLARETDRVELRAQLKDVLSAEELDDFGAALGRRPVVATGSSVVAFNTEIRALQQRIIDVARPAVLIDRAFPPNGAAR